jgi:hypothetical protein
MGRPNQLAIVCSSDLLAKLDVERKRREALAGVEIPLSRVVVSLVEAQLDAREASKAPGLCPECGAY